MGGEKDEKLPSEAIADEAIKQAAVWKATADEAIKQAAEWQVTATKSSALAKKAVAIVERMQVWRFLFFLLVPGLLSYTTITSINRGCGGEEKPREVKVVGAPDAVCVRYETQFWADDPELYKAYQNFDWDLNWQAGAVAAYWKDPGVVIELAEPLDDDIGSVQGNWCWGKQPYEQVVNHPDNYGEVELAPNWKVRQTGPSIAWAGLTLVEWNDEAKTERLERPFYDVVVNVVMKTNPHWREDVELLCKNQTGSNGVCDLDMHLIRNWDDEAWLCWMSRLEEMSKNDVNWRELKTFLSGILDYGDHMLGIEDPLWCLSHPYQCKTAGEEFCQTRAERLKYEERCLAHPEECR